MKKKVPEEQAESKPEEEETESEKEEVKEDKEKAEGEPEEKKEEDKGILAIAQTHYYVGNKAYYEEHNYIKAIEEYTQAVEEEKDELIHLRAVYMMGESYVKAGKIKEAIKVFKTISKKSSEHYLRDSARRRIIKLSEDMEDLQ